MRSARAHASTVPASRRARVSGRFASSTHSTYSRRCVYDMPANVSFTAGSAARAARRSAGTRTVRGLVSNSISTCTRSPASTPVAAFTDDSRRCAPAVVDAGSRPPRVTANGHRHRWSCAPERLVQVERHAEHRGRLADSLELYCEALRGHPETLESPRWRLSGSSVTATSCASSPGPSGERVRRCAHRRADEGVLGRR